MMSQAHKHTRVPTTILYLSLRDWSCDITRYPVEMIRRVTIILWLTLWHGIMPHCHQMYIFNSMLDTVTWRDIPLKWSDVYLWFYDWRCDMTLCPIIIRCVYLIPCLTLWHDVIIIPFQSTDVDPQIVTFSMTLMLCRHRSPASPAVVGCSLLM